MKRQEIIRRLCLRMLRGGGNRPSSLLLAGALVFAFVLGSCTNQLLPEPAIRTVTEEGEPGPAKSPWGAPAELTASQGKKGAISLSWMPVSGAVRYLIYKSESPLSEFIQCGETANDTPAFDVNYVPPGTTLYFKVAALNKRSETSGRSAYTAGRSLAQPVIYSIEPDQNDAGTVTVYWSMNNMEANTYEEKIRYAVSCYRGSALIAEIPVSSFFAGDPFVKFTGLLGSTEYEFEVEAWLDGNDGDREPSGRLDAETARRLKPGAPVELTTNPGTAKDAVTLSFKLPEKAEVLEMVDGVKTYVPHDLYFDISRREAGSNGGYDLLRSHFGENPAEFGGYTEGATVSWTDSSLGDHRGVKYEYKVQAYVNGVDSEITAPTSIATVTGWAMARPVIAINAPVYTGGDGGGDYTHAQLSLSFDHNAQGVAYSYVLKESIRPIPDGDPRNGTVDNEYSLSAGEIASYIANINLSQASTASSKGRGLYAYSVQVFLEGTLVEQVDTVGSVRVFEKNTSDIIVKDFAVKDGYPDEFFLTWTWQKNRKYVIKSSSSASGPWAPAGELGPSDINDGSTYTWRDDNGIASGTSRYYSICALEGDLEGATYYTPEMKTLGTPALELKANSLSYDTITLTWAPVQKADTYRVRYRYAGDSSYTEAPISAADLSQSAGNYVYGLKPFGGGALDAAKAGKLMDIKLEALNEARRIADGGGDIKTVSNVISNARLFGPAGLGEAGAFTATQNTSADSITLTWKEVDGAAGYYVVRQQYNMENNAPKRGIPVFFYVNARTGTVTGKDLALSAQGPEDSTAVSATVTIADGTLTLKDAAIGDADYQAKLNALGGAEGYVNEQNEMFWGFPYRYHVIPVLSEGHQPLIIEGGIYSVNGAAYSAAFTNSFVKTGRALGFVLDVEATKGTGAEPGKNINDRIVISWEKPDHITGTPSYYVFRRREAVSSDPWIALTNSAITATELEDKMSDSGGPAVGTVYEYIVGISLGGATSHPEDNVRFLQDIRTKVDNGERQISGFILPQPTIILASRTSNEDEGGYYEIVKWNAAAVDKLYSEQNNRGTAGYIIEVRNQKNTRDWEKIGADVPLPVGNDPSEFEAKVYNTTSGLLNVLRDYRHYFRIRSYASNADGEKILSPPPEELALGLENDFIKWGTRPITATEFAGLTSLAIGTVMAGTSYPYKSGSFDYGDQKTSYPLNKTLFDGSLTISGTLEVTTTKIFWGSADITKYGSNLTFSFNDPGVSFVYSGSVKIENLTKDNGKYSVKFDSAADFSEIARKYIIKPFTFSGTTAQGCDGFYNWTAANGWQ